jgi:ProP effector
MIDAHRIIEMLSQKFPACFAVFELRRKPLAIGIHKEIALAMPALTEEQIHAVMRVYVTNAAYLRACREGAPRINLMGHEAGVVTSAEADNCAARLAGIKAAKKKKKETKEKAAKLAAARAPAIEAVPKGPNALKPKLTLGAMRS